MSDDEVSYVKKTKTIHYGSLEDSERARLEAMQDEESSGSSEPEPSAPAPPPPEEQNEYLELEESMARDKQALLEEFERRKKARSINVSTDDGEVKRNLRQLGEPICLFGEGPAERRSRLRDILSRLGEDSVIRREAEEERKLFEKDQEQTWYHEGPESLIIARRWIAEYSLPRAKARLEEARKLQDLPATTKTAK